jgi:hypothetical protein
MWIASQAITVASTHGPHRQQTTRATHKIWHLLALARRHADRWAPSTIFYVLQKKYLSGSAFAQLIRFFAGRLRRNLCPGQTLPVDGQSLT